MVVVVEMVGSGGGGENVGDGVGGGGWGKAACCLTCRICLV